MTMVISHVEVEPPPPSTHTQYGFDLDGMVGGDGCTGRMDFTSATTGENGVDNQFGPVGSQLFDLTYQDHDMATFQQAVDHALQDGSWLLVLDVTGIDDAWNDRDVMVEVHRVTSAGTPAVATSGDLAAGGTFTSMALVGNVHARITEGALDVRLPSLDVTLGHLYPEAHLLDARIGGTIGPDGMPDAAIGGAITMDQVVTIASSTGGLSLSRAELESVLGPDLIPDAAGTSCADVSVGIGARAVLATLAP
jgi:hypothetical protein